MNNLDCRIEKIKGENSCSFEGCYAGTIPPIWELFTFINSSLEDHPEIKEDLNIYYERLCGKVVLLAFRMPSLDSHLILKFRTYNCPKSKRGTTIENMQGEASWILLNAIARKIIPTLKSAEEYYSFRNPEMYLSSCMISSKARKSRVMEMPYTDELLLEKKQINKVL